LNEIYIYIYIYIKRNKIVSVEKTRKWRKVYAEPIEFYDYKLDAGICNAILNNYVHNRL